MMWLLAPKNSRPELCRRMRNELVQLGGSTERNVGRYVYFTLNPKVSRRYGVSRSCGNNRCIAPAHLVRGVWNPPEYKLNMENYLQHCDDEKNLE